MADLGTIRTNLATRVATISGLRASAYLPEQVSPPMALIGGPTSARRLAIGSSKRRWSIPIRVLVSSASNRAGQNALDDYLVLGTTSIDDAIDGDKTLGGAVDTCIVRDSCSGYGVYEHNGMQFWGFEVLVEVIG